jgi:hypothetical protein
MAPSDNATMSQHDGVCLIDLDQRPKELGD